MSANTVIFGTDAVMQTGHVFNVRHITDSAQSPFTLTKNSGPYGGKDFVLSVDTTSAITIYLPTDSDNGLTNGRVYNITSTTPTTNITINGTGKNISGSSTKVINTGGDSVTILYSSTADQWFII